MKYFLICWFFESIDYQLTLDVREWLDIFSHITPVWIWRASVVGSLTFHVFYRLHLHCNNNKYLLVLFLFVEFVFVDYNIMHNLVLFLNTFWLYKLFFVLMAPLKRLCNMSSTIKCMRQTTVGLYFFIIIFHFFFGGGGSLPIML